MILEALKFLTDLGRKADSPQPLDKTPWKARYVIGGEIRDLPIAPRPRSHQPATLVEIIDLANRFHRNGGDPSPVIWYDGEGVVLVIDDADYRIETATLNLELSDVFATLMGLRSGQPKLDHKSFVRLLRIDLAGTLPPGDLLDKICKIKFENGAIASSRLGRADESLGRAITSRVQAEQGEIPEVVTLSAPVFKTPGETAKYPVRCAVEVDPMHQTFQLIPLPDEIERVLDLAVGSIAERLGEGLEKGIPFYQGKP